MSKSKLTGSDYRWLVMFFCGTAVAIALVITALTGRYHV